MPHDAGMQCCRVALLSSLLVFVCIHKRDQDAIPASRCQHICIFSWILWIAEVYTMIMPRYRSISAPRHVCIPDGQIKFKFTNNWLNKKRKGPIVMHAAPDRAPSISFTSRQSNVSHRKEREPLDHSELFLQGQLEEGAAPSNLKSSRSVRPKLRRIKPFNIHITFQCKHYSNSPFYSCIHIDRPFRKKHA